MVEVPRKYDVFQAIADPTRRKLLELLAGEQLSISVMTRHFTMSRTAVTKHLHILEVAGLVHSQKVGREKMYCLDAKPLQNLQHWLSFYEHYWDDKLSKLKSIVESEGKAD